MEWWSGTRSLTLLTVASGNFVQFGSRLLIGAVVPLLLIHFETTRATIGFALTGMWAVYALTQFPSGILADRFSERVIMLVALCATCSGTIVVALSPTIAHFSFALIFLGVGSGLFFPPAATLVTRLYENQGQALSSLTASGALAGMVFPVVGGIVGVWSGWRTAVILGAMVIIVVIVATILIVPRLTPIHSGRRLQILLNGKRHWSLLRRPNIVFSVFLGTITAYSFQAVSSFFPTFLIEYHGIGTAFAALAFGLVFGLSTIAQPIAGRLSDQVSRDAAICTSIGLALIGLVILLLVSTPIGLLVGVVALGMGISWSGPVQARIFDNLSTDERGYGYGLSRTVYMLLGSTSSMIVGNLVDYSGWIAGIGSLVLVLFSGVLLIGINKIYINGL